MSPKKKVNKAEAKKTEKTIQYVAIAMIVIVIALVAWPMLPSCCSKSGCCELPRVSVGGCWKRNCVRGI